MRIIVVGAGIIGLFTAFELRRSGHQVTLVSPSVGQGASHAAAGMLAPVSEVQYGQERLYPLMLRSRAEYPCFLAGLEQYTDLPTGYVENGTWFVAKDRADLQRIQDLATHQRSHGLEVTPVTSAEVRRSAPGLVPGLAGVLAAPSDHQLDPRQAVRAAYDALTSTPRTTEPVEVIEDSVTAVHQDTRGHRHTESHRLTPTHAHDGQVRVELASGARVSGAAVVLAAGLDHHAIGGDPARSPLPLRPVYGEVIRLTVPQRLLVGDETNLIGRTLRAIVHGRPVYLTPRPTGELVVGASSREDCEPGLNTGAVLDLLEDAAAILPALRETGIGDITCRARPGTPDDIPYLGPLRHAPRIIVSTGYHRHGILLAPLAARLGAALAGAAATGTTPALPPDDEAHLNTMNPHRTRTERTEPCPT